MARHVWRAAFANAVPCMQLCECVCARARARALCCCASGVCVLRPGPQDVLVSSGGPSPLVALYQSLHQLYAPLLLRDPAWSSRLDPKLQVRTRAHVGAPPLSRTPPSRAPCPRSTPIPPSRPLTHKHTVIMHAPAYPHTRAPARTRAPEHQHARPCAAARAVACACVCPYAVTYRCRCPCVGLVCVRCRTLTDDAHRPGRRTGGHRAGGRRCEPAHVSCAAGVRVCRVPRCLARQRGTVDAEAVHVRTPRCLAVRWCALVRVCVRVRMCARVCGGCLFSRLAGAGAGSSLDNFSGIGSPMDELTHWHTVSRNAPSSSDRSRGGALAPPRGALCVVEVFVCWSGCTLLCHIVV
jgi:hypothetical protein